jgi:mono/diheme cytochrome c family protein
MGSQQPGVYTAQQATAGRTAFQANCAGCHLADLSGQGDAAPLRGTAFMTAWGTRSTKELLSFMQLTMPPQSPGRLSPQQYLDITAYILQQNGVAAGTQAFTANTEVPIRALSRPHNRCGAARRPPAPTARPAGPRGITVAAK